MLIYRVILIGLGAAALFWGHRIVKKNNIAIPWGVFTSILAGLYFLFYLWLKFAQYYSFNINAHDFSVFQYALHATWQGKWLYVAFWKASFFKEHFSPLLILLVPIYGVFKNAAFLLVLQSLAVVAAAWPLWRIARDILKSPEMGFWMVLIYFNQWHVVHGLLYEFHVEMFMPFIILMMLMHFLQQRRWFWVYFVLALMCKEDVPIYLFFFGMIAMIEKKHRKTGAWVMAITVIWFVMALLVISMFDNRGWNIMGYSFFDSWHSGKRIVFNISSLLRMFLPLFGIPFLHLWGLFAAAPLLINLSSANPLQSNLMLYYAAPVIPFVFFALIFGIRTFQTWTPVQIRPIMMAVLTAGLVVFNLHIYKPDKVVARHRTGSAIVRQIDCNQVVAAQGNLVPHLKYCPKLQVLPEMTREAQTVIWDLEGNPFPMTKESRDAHYRDMANDSQYEKSLQKQGFVIFRRKNNSAFSEHK
ncbi:DUF2079 domain-containing protein [bacterium]|nr:DUF2079 domain-containing protein [bacterium]